MAMERQQNPFDTPIPGQSLTDEPKNYVWENPPRFAKVEDSATFIWERLHKKETLSKIILMLQTHIHNLLVLKFNFQLPLDIKVVQVLMF